MPSAPFFQPAASRIWLALSRLNSHFVFFEAKRGGGVQEVGGGDAGAAVDLLLDGGAVDEEVQGLADGGIGQERVLGLDAGALAVDLLPRIGVVELDVLDVAAGHDVGLALAALLHALEDLVLDLHVPGVVELAGLDDGAGGRDRVAAALHLDGVEVRAVGHVVGRVELARTMSPGLKSTNL